MQQDESQTNILAEWFDKINAKQRAKSVCKPCWEIKYCPYGPLIEQFPYSEDKNDPRRCRVFGHLCPVFFVAEPLTETKELRNISRTISRPTQFRVLKRENQVCRKCGQPVADNDIHFDHIIPWSKGGSSDENNIQLLCSECNLRKSANFEKDYLVANAFDHMKELVDHKILGYLMLLAKFAHDFYSQNKRYPNADDIADLMNGGEKGEPEEQGAIVISDFVEFFAGKRPEELKAKLFQGLKTRWGFDDGFLYTLEDVAKKYDQHIDDLLDAEISLVGRLGWVVSLNKLSRKKWLNYKFD